MAQLRIQPSPLQVGARTLAGMRRTNMASRIWTPAFREPIAIWLLTRALLLGITYFAYVLLETALPAGHPVLVGPHPSFLHQLLPAWNRWDTAWYIEIAQRGYGWKKAAGTGPAAFFPLYPMLIRGAVWLTHRSYFDCALAVSNVCFLGALIYLWRLAAHEVDRSTAWRALLYIAIFPTALFFFAGYTESLFLLLTVVSFYYLRRGDWLLAGVFGGLASATRVTGVLLVLPFAYEYARSCSFNRRRVDGRALFILLVPAGLLAFMLYLYETLGDALAFTHYQSAWQKIFTLRLWAGMEESIRQIIEQPDASFIQVYNVLNLGIGLLFLLFTILAIRRLPLSYACYTVPFWLVTLSSPAMAGGYPVPLVSLSRYVLALFPVFIYMGILGERRGFHDAYVVLSVGLLALLTALFVTGRWIV